MGWVDEAAALPVAFAQVREDPALDFSVLDRIGPTRTGICMAFEAVTGIALAAIFLGESVRPVVALGGAAVLAGAVLAALISPAPVEARERSSPP